MIPARMPSQGFELTPEQRAKQEERRRKKEERTKAGPVAVAIDEQKGRIVQRPWVKVQEPQGKGEIVKIMTWNVCTHGFLANAPRSASHQVLLSSAFGSVSRP